MKMTKSRQNYKCNSCQNTILKGDMYRKKIISIGSPHKPDKVIKTETGGIAFEMQGIKYAVQICGLCVEKAVLT